MKSILIKVDDKVKKELDLIREEEGFGNQTSTIVFLIKYYLLTKNNRLDTTISALDKVLNKLDTKKLPSLKEQFKDL
ncbi:hypothetical protein KKG71_06330 [Patescibacteria group bacterium]|nr:hypothetical protein [Patescibacteria group bacterium]